mmetsp:Transcript_66682/g.171707  ORF Transcript_66682/g.171707 Transcript_66682/m.171707 type:complete len:200 (+) Transcript_66682:3632-4231(+)
MKPAASISARMGRRSFMAWGLTMHSVRCSCSVPSGKKVFSSFSAASNVRLPCTALLVLSVPQRALIEVGAQSLAIPEFVGPQRSSHLPMAPGPSRQKATTPGSCVSMPTAPVKSSVPAYSAHTSSASSFDGVRFRSPTMKRPAAAASSSNTSVRYLPSIFPLTSPSALTSASVRSTCMESRWGKKNSRSRMLSHLPRLQ